MSRRARGGCALMATLLLSEEGARAAERDPPAEVVVSGVAPCALPLHERPPDPRCGEPLDGRAPAEPTDARQFARAALVVPRLATQAVLWPAVATTTVIERHQVLDWTRALLTSDDGLVGVSPEVQYATGFLPSAGARVFYRRLPGPGTELMASFRTAGPAVLVGQLGWRGPDWTGLALVGTWNRRNDRLFAGIGPNTEGELAGVGQGSARYASNNLGAGLHWTHRLPARLLVQAHGGVERRDYWATDVNGGPSVTARFGLPAEACAARSLPAPCVDEAEMPGFYTGLRVARAGGGLGLDLRKRSRDGSGFSLSTDSTFTRGVAGDPSRHATYSAETVAALGGSDKVLLVRARATMVDNLSGVPIPFDELVRPAASIDMRGFPDGRLRGQSGLFGSAEYRWYISGDLDATLFADVGTVADARFSGLDRSRWFPSYGLGFRFYNAAAAYWEARPLAGLQIAYAPEGNLRLLLSTAPF
jgi:hypothetical protein